MRGGRHKQAIPLLERVVATFPENSTDLTYAYALYNLGRSLRLAGRPCRRGRGRRSLPSPASARAPVRLSCRARCVEEHEDTLAVELAVLVRLEAEPLPVASSYSALTGRQESPSPTCATLRATTGDRRRSRLPSQRLHLGRRFAGSTRAAASQPESALAELGATRATQAASARDALQSHGARLRPPCRRGSCSKAALS
jgi:hypothetical protein